ncbi:MAG: right-handed parallel beta-helix repeat-containing protein [Planctomycetota bacterium]
MLKFAATAAPTAAGLGALANAFSPLTASADSLGIRLDYAAGVLGGVDIKEGGPERLTTTNVRSFGAVGDGVTDDSAAIHAARDASGVGGTVLFPPGTYLTTGLLATSASQVWNIMPGATIRQSGAARALITVDAAGVTITGGGTVDGGRLMLGDRPNNVLAVILGTLDSDNLTVENIYVTEAPYYGIIGQGSHSRILRCRFYRNYWAEIYLSSWVSMGTTVQNTYDNEIIGNYVDCTAEDPATFAHTAINIRGNYTASGTQYYSYRGKILNNTVIIPPGCTNTDGNACGIVLGFNAQGGLISGNIVVNGVLGISIPRSTNGRVVGNTIVGGTLAAIELPNAPGAVVEGNVIDGQGTLGSLSSGCGIWIDDTGTTDVSIVGNRIFGINNVGRSISAGYTSRVTVTGNSFESRYGITLNKMSEVTISNNTFLGDNVAYAVGLINTSSAVVSGNAIKNYNQGVQIYVSSGTSDHLDISNNQL